MGGFEQLIAIFIWPLDQHTRTHLIQLYSLEKKYCKLSFFFFSFFYSNFLSKDSHLLHTIVNTYCSDVFIHKSFFAIPLNKTRFSNLSITYRQHLQKDLRFLLSHDLIKEKKNKQEMFDAKKQNFFKIYLKLLSFRKTICNSNGRCGYSR